MLELATALRDRLAAEQRRIVLVESCTAGRVAATLGELPGISQWLCGSLVVYRNASKSSWLGVPDSLLDDPKRGPVSESASHWLARAALERTSEADLAVAVTGDIGPNAPPATDGHIFLAAAVRIPQSGTISHALTRPDAIQINQQELHLRAPAPRSNSDIAARRLRLDEATRATLSFAIAQLRS